MNFKLIFPLFVIVFLSSCTEEIKRVDLPIVEKCQFELGYLKVKEIELNLPFEADYSYNPLLGWICTGREPFVEEIRNDYLWIKVSHKYNEPEEYDDFLFDYYQNEIDIDTFFAHRLYWESRKNSIIDTFLFESYFVENKGLNKLINSSFQTAGKEIVSIHHDYTKVSNKEYLNISFVAYLDDVPEKKSIDDIKNEITFILENYKEYN